MKYDANYSINLSILIFKDYKMRQKFYELQVADITGC